MIKSGDRIRITASHLEAYNWQTFVVTWVGGYAMSEERNPVAHFYAAPEETSIERMRGSFAYATEYEKVD